MATTDNRLPTEGTQIDIEARLGAIESVLQALVSSISPAAVNVTFNNTGTEISASNVNAALAELDGEKVSKDGDTMTGNLVVSKTAPRYYVKNTGLEVDTSATNGVTEETGASVNYVDSNSNSTGNIYNYASTNGTITTQIQARNRKQNGDWDFNVLRTIMNKDGTKTYYMSSPTNFRSALNIKDTPTSVYKSDTVAVASGITSYTTICNTGELAVGKWVVTYYANFPNTSTGNNGTRRMMLTTSSTSTSNAYTSVVNGDAATGVASTLTGAKVIDLTEAKTLYLRVSHSQGASLNVTGEIRAVRINPV